LRISSLVRGPSLATVGGALLGRRMGRSPILWRKALFWRIKGGPARMLRASGRPSGQKPPGARYFSHGAPVSRRSGRPDRTLTRHCRCTH